MKSNTFRVLLLIAGFLAVVSALFWMLHRIRIALWPRSAYQTEFGLPGTSEPAWGPWLVVALPVLLIFLALMYRQQIRDVATKFLNK